MCFVHITFIKEWYKNVLNQLKENKMTLEITKQDLSALDAASDLNGWQLQECVLIEAKGRGSLRNGLAINSRGNGYCVHSFVIQEDGIASYHNGNYVKSFADALSAYKRRERNHAVNWKG